MEGCEAETWDSAAEALGLAAVLEASEVVDLEGN